jgi:hypothetical protein
MLAGLSWPVYQSYQKQIDLDVTTQGIADSLRRAQTYARSGNGDSVWGVRILSDSAVLYKGATYASRNAAYDELTNISNAFATGGLSDISFGKFTATPSITGGITLTADNNNVRTITINEKGTVSY